MLSRRHALKMTLAASAAWAGSRQASLANRPSKLAKHCIILWMDGGPSQLETFDPKPGTITGGPTRSIATDIPGLAFADNLPHLAKLAGDLNVIRSLTSDEGEHERAKYLNHTGFKPISAFPRPELGALVAHQSHDGKLPGFITLGQDTFGPAYLGLENASFVIENAGRTRQLLKQLQSKRSRFSLLEELNKDFDSEFNFGAVRERKATLSRVEGLLETGLSQVLDLESESQRTRDRFGENPFGQNVLLARRLIEEGVSCVEVQMGGWDTHRDNFAAVARLCGALDRAFASLIEDLKQRQLWEETLVVWMGDFGRTPTINPQSGRDHFPRISNVVLAGGCLPGGVVYGQTNSTGVAIEESPATNADLFATLLSKFGIAADAEYTTTFGSPTQATDQGSEILALRA